MFLNALKSRVGSIAGCALLLLTFCVPCLTSSLVLAAQAPAPAANRVVGTVTTIEPGVLTVKVDNNGERKVTVPDGIRIQRVAPGAKDLSSAAAIPFSELAVGDRVLVRIAPEPATDPVTAVSIIAIPQADLAKKQQQDREDWQRNGVGGLVQSVNAGTGVVVIVNGAGALQKTITLHTTPATVLRRYAADSVDFDKATKAPIETIQVGDQLRARGTKNADGTELAAVDVVSGSFRNISGVISTVNQAAMTITLKDLATKQNVTVHVSADVQMRKLPDTMAKMLANLTNGSGAAGSGGGQAGGAAASAPGGQQRNWSGGAGSGGAGPGAAGGDAGAARPAYGAPGGQSGQGGDWASRRSGGGDLQQMLSRAPAIHLTDLQKGEAVMLVSTQGTSEVTAVTLLAGVEPLLQAPASTQNMLLSGWNMSSGSAEAAQ
jgi:hypothetical protein